MSAQDKNGPHNAPIFYKDPKTGKPIDTGFKKAAIEDYNKRLIVNTEKSSGGR